MKSYLVIGLGRFGSTVAQELCALGNEVLALDTHPDHVQKISSFVTTAVTGDARDVDVLRALDARSFDCAIVAIGTDLATAVLVTLNLKELGVPNIVCKAQDETQKKALEMIGADRVVIPERETGMKLAQNLTSDSVLDFIELSSDYGIAEVLAQAKWQGMSLAQLNIRAKYGLDVIAIKRKDEILVSPGADSVVRANDILVVVGRNVDVARMKTK